MKKSRAPASSSRASERSTGVRSDDPRQRSAGGQDVGEVGKGRGAHRRWPRRTRSSRRVESFMHSIIFSSRRLAAAAERAGVGEDAARPVLLAGGEQRHAQLGQRRWRAAELARPGRGTPPPVELLALVVHPAERGERELLELLRRQVDRLRRELQRLVEVLLHLRQVARHLVVGDRLGEVATCPRRAAPRRCGCPRGTCPGCAAPRSASRRRSPAASRRGSGPAPCAPPPRSPGCGRGAGRAARRT